MCESKFEGGLGICDCVKWNFVIIGKLVWDIVLKVDKFWVRWVNYVYIKGKNWWEYNLNDDLSWVWKKICKFSEKCFEL